MEDILKLMILLKEVFLVLAGGLIGVIGNLVLEKYKVKQNILKLQRERLEKLYVDTDTMLKQIGAIEMYQKTKDNSYLSLFSNYNIDTQFGMIVDFYFPEMKESKNEFLKVYSPIVVSFMNTKIEQNRFDAFYRMIKSFFEAIKDESKKLQ